MTGADFSTRIDVQQPNPALLPVIGDALSGRFSDGVSNYRDRLEHSLRQSPSAATTRRRARVQPPGGGQQQVSSASSSVTSSARVAANSRRSVSQPSPQTRHRRPTSQTTASTTAEPAPRPSPASDQPSPPTHPKNDNSPTPVATVTSSAAGVSADETPAVEVATARTVAQRTTSTETAPAETAPAETAPAETAPAETAPAEGTPPVHLQLFTIAEVSAQSLLADSVPSGNERVPGSASQSSKGSDPATDLKQNDLPDSNVLIPLLGIFVGPNPADAATNSSKEADATTGKVSQGETMPAGSNTNGLSVTVDNSQSGQAESATDAQIPQQLVSMPSLTETSIRSVATETIQQSTTASGSGSEDVSSVTDASGQAIGKAKADFGSVRPTEVVADGHHTTTPNDTSTAIMGSVESSATAGLGKGVNSKVPRRGDNSSSAGTQATGTTSAKAGNQSGPTPPTGQANPVVTAASSPLVSETPSTAEFKSPVTGSQTTDVGGSTTDSHNAAPVAGGTVSTSLREIGSARTTNGPQGRQTAELVDRVATAVHSAHQSQRELRIRLTPPELGTVRIEVSSRGGLLTARLEVETAAAQQTIQQNLSLLHDALAQHGTNLGRIDVHLAPSRGEEGQPQSGGQHQPDTQQQQQQQQQPRQEHQQRRQGSQEPQRAKDEQSPGQSGSSRSLDELDIQV